MGNISDLTIPEFIYLDDQKVDMALSVLEGSVTVQSRARKSKASTRGGSGRLGLQSIVGVGGSVESSSGGEVEELKTLNEYISRIVGAV